MIRRLSAFGFVLALLSTSLFAPAFAADDEALPPSLLAVAAASNDQKAQVSTTLAGAAYYLIYSNQGKYHKSIQNDKKGVASVAAQLSAQGVSVFVAQRFDQSTLDGLTAQDIIPMRRTGSVESAVISLLQCEPDSPAAKKEKAK